MNIQSRADKLKMIEWQRVGTGCHEADCVAAKVFLQRAAAYLVRIGAAGQHPFFNFAKFQNATELSSVVAEVESIVGDIKFPLAKRIAVFHVLANDAEDEETQQLYEPLIEIFQRGGSVDYHSGELIVDGEWSIPLRNWIERFSSVSS